MKKLYALLFICFFSITFLKAQFIVITSVNTIPGTPVDTEDVRIVVSSEFGSGSCFVTNSFFTTSSDTLFLNVFYQTGILSVICDATDTFNVGMLPCTISTLNVAIFSSGGTVGGAVTSQPVNITCTPTGILSYSNENGLQVFPNPASGELNLKMNERIFSHGRISVLNLLGQKIFSTEDSRTGTDSPKRIDISALAKGIYVIKVENPDGVIVKRFLKN